MPFVFDFDHTHPRPPMELKDLLGGKGANLAEMTSVLELPVPPGFTISTDACRAYMTGGWPKEPRRRGGGGPGPPRDGHGQGDRRRRRPAARLGALRGQVLHARHDGHRPQPRPQRRVGRGPGQADRATSASPSTPTGASSPCTRGSCWSCPARSSTRSSTRPRSWPARRRTPRCPTELLRYLVDSYQQIVERHTGKPFPQEPGGAAPRRHRGRVPQLERPARHRLPRPGAHRARPRHGGQRAGHGLRQPRRQLGHRRRLHPRPGHGRQGRLRRLPGQRPGRGRRGRHPQHRAHLGAQEAVPQGPRASCSRSSPASRATTATCATPSSPSSRASSGCSRPGWASAPAPPP